MGVLKGGIYGSRCKTYGQATYRSAAESSSQETLRNDEAPASRNRVETETGMTVKGKSIYHCSGKNKGKKYRTYESAAKAKQVHRAIQANKNK